MFGKSTIINMLAGRAIAKTGNEPAITKQQQHINIGDELILLDTPGILWPKQEYEKSSFRLAATGAIKNTAMDYSEVAFFTAEYLLRAYPDLLKARYELNELPQTEQDFFEQIAYKRGCLCRGGRIDFNKISQLFINDLRTGMIGSITLETPLMIEQEKLEQEANKEQKQALRQHGLEKYKKGRKA